MFEKNVGSIDKLIRIVAGIALISQVFVGPFGPSMLGWIGVVPLATALVNWCPLYSLIGVKTCPQR